MSYLRPAIVALLALAALVAVGADAALEVKKLTALDAQAGDHFGNSVAVSADIAIVGAGFEDAGAADAGAAYIRERNLGGADNWDQRKKLTASDPQLEDNFGTSVAVSGDIAIVGARFEDTEGSEAGAAYVFDRNLGGADNWGERKKLTASDAEAGDRFGFSVAVSGDIVIVGANLEDSKGGDAGAVYVFERDFGGANNWGERKILTALDTQTGDQFGVRVAVNGNTLVVGATRENAGGAFAGAAYIFERNLGGADNWGERKKLIPKDLQPGDLFGSGVAVSGDTAIVGARTEDEGGADAGAAYVFERDEGGTDNWGEVKKLTASDAQAGDVFGGGVAVSGDTAIVGAPLEDEEGDDAGAAYVFQRDEGGAGNWGQVGDKFTASDAQAGHEFGISVGISADTTIVGATREGPGPGDAGAAYVFKATEPANTQPGTNVCVSLNGGLSTVGGVEVCFSQVITSGNTTLVTSIGGPPPPTGLKVVGVGGQPQYYDINTSSTFSGLVTVCIRYDETEVGGPESNLKLMQRVTGFVNITQLPVDTIKHIICGQTTTLSIFAVMAPLGAPVGGIVEVLVDGSDASPRAAEGSGLSTDGYAAIAGGIAAGLALVAGGWYIHRRWLR